MDDISTIRQFNRSYTQHIGALENRFLGRHRSLGLSRVLFETGKSGIEIRNLRKRLELDSGYTSRLIKQLETEGLLKVCSSEQDGRVRLLKLTSKGLRELDILNRLSDQSAESMLTPLNDKQRSALIGAMQTIERLVKIGDITLSIADPESQSAQKCIENYYRELSTRFNRGFDPTKSIPATVNELTPPNGYLIVAQLDDQPVGCGALKCHQKIGEIKRMWVDKNYRGYGIGRSILNQLEAIAKQSGLTRLRLETNKSLTKAQSLYRASGYTEVPPFNDEPYADHWFEKKL